MKTVAALCALVLICANLHAHGGQFNGPPGGVPPGIRPPSDPEPPPPPPGPTPEPAPPTTPNDDPQPPVTGKPETTPGDGTGGIGQPQPQGGNRARPKTGSKSLTYESWRFWWGYNKADILNLKRNSMRPGVNTHTIFNFGNGDENVRNPVLVARKVVEQQIVPALRRRLDDPHDHEDIHGGALVALGKVGSAELIPMFADAMWNRYRTSKGVRVDFGFQATESGVLALGLLPDMDETARAAIRKTCLEAILSEKLRTRERAWAAICLGLQRDKEAIAPLWELLKKRYKNDNIPAGILAGIGLVGSTEEAPYVTEELAEAFLRGRLFGKRLSARLHAFVGYALTKWGDKKALPQVLQVLKARSMGVLVKRSAAIAAGVLAADAGKEEQDQAVRRLLSFIRKTGDPSAQNFALIALSQIGSPKAVQALMDYSEGKYSQRPFAALGLATMVFYHDNAGRRFEGLDGKMRGNVVAHLAKLSHKFKSKDLKAALYLSRGIAGDRTAVDELTQAVVKRGEDPVLRAYACVGLGLIGDRRAEVRDALKLALKTRKSTELRVSAAIGLELLNDASVLPLLLTELEASKSFAVQGQLIQAIGRIGDHKAIEPLIRILENDKKPAVTRAMAAVGLGMIGDLKPLPTLSRLGKNYNYRASVREIDELLFIL